MTIAVSFSRKTGLNAADHLNFLVAHGPFENIKNFVLKRPWSPIVFKDGVRKKTNFLSSSLIALDFDSGEWTLDDAVNFSTERKHSAIIATTKSHQKPKGDSPACDRFRVIIHAEETTSLDDFEYTMKQYMVDTPCDKSCKDGARFYYPCSEIYATLEGTPAKWLKAKQQSDARRETPLSDMRNLFTLPAAIWTYIVHGTNTERHKTAVVVSCELARRGFDGDEIFALFVKHNSPLLNIGEGSNHVSRCIDYAVTAVASELDERRKKGTAEGGTPRGEG